MLSRYLGFPSPPLTPLRQGEQKGHPTPYPSFELIVNIIATS